MQQAAKEQWQERNEETQRKKNDIEIIREKLIKTIEDNKTAELLHCGKDIVKDAAKHTTSKSQKSMQMWTKMIDNATKFTKEMIRTKGQSQKKMRDFYSPIIY